MAMPARDQADPFAERGPSPQVQLEVMVSGDSPNRPPAQDGLPSIAGFDVEELIGEGGFSQVYSATQQTPKRPAAIKVFRTSGRIGTRVRERFKRESDVIGALSSQDGLVSVFTGGFTASGAPYLAMELCEGGSIADRIRAVGPLPASEVFAVGERIGSALAVLHRQGVVHRDIKPSNILLKADGRAVLTDFGLSVVGQMTEAFGEESRLAMTEVYAPPERLNPGVAERPGVDAAGDQYSFALTLYSMLLGGSPFTGETTTKRALKALTSQLEPLERDDLPAEAVQVLHKALSRRPEDRWASVSAFVLALSRASKQISDSSPQLSETGIAPSLLRPPRPVDREQAESLLSASEIPSSGLDPTVESISRKASAKMGADPLTGSEEGSSRYRDVIDSMVTVLPTQRDEAINPPELAFFLRPLGGSRRRSYADFTTRTVDRRALRSELARQNQAARRVAWGTAITTVVGFVTAVAAAGGTVGPARTAVAAALVAIVAGLIPAMSRLFGAIARRREDGMVQQAMSLSLRVRSVYDDALRRSEFVPQTTNNDDRRD